MKLRHILHKIPIFSGLDDEELQALETLVACVDVPAKNIVFQEGDPGESLYLIIKGEVKVSSFSLDGRELVYALLSEGSFFGEISLMEKQVRSATVTTMEPSTFAHIRRRDLAPLLLKQPTITVKLLEEVVRRLVHTSRMLELVSVMDVPHRLYAYLVDHCRNYCQQEDDGWYSTRLPTHQLLADQLSTTRESVSRVISALKQDGLLFADGGRSHIRVNVPELEARLESL
jgi:CRP-like cAMP-binding protein